MNSVITLTTDFGLSDPFVGIMKGVMLGINPSVRFIDISHQIEPQNIAHAYYILNFSYKYFPPGTIHLCVVDPGVGSIRRPILVEVVGQGFSPATYFVGPDNGIFSFIFKNEPESRVIELTEKRFFLSSVSQTFHGRDIFASVAAHLSTGVNPSEFGKPVNDPVILNIPEPKVFPSFKKRGQGRFEENEIQGEVIYTDRFGNLITNIPATLIPPHPPLEKGGRGDFQIKIKDFIAPLCKSYSDAGDLKPSSILNSWGLLEIFMKNKDVGRELGVEKGEKVIITAKSKIQRSKVTT
ncbi:MAG: SAM-dependent chlorinase/fluorinase, partial [Nitrospinae bacterium]|nr:SAM-dependent chlorinase/fluorinase [Nitrospinota bacterium]